MAGTIKCTSCGVEISPDVSFCEFCGAALTPGSAPIGESEAAQTPPVPPNRPKNLSNEFTERYSSMCDEDLLRLTRDLQSLVPPAREALWFEIDRRHLQVETRDWATQPATSSDRASLVMARYSDGYRYARIIDGFGSLIEVLACLFGGLIALIGIYGCLSSAQENPFGGQLVAAGGTASFITGVLVGVIGYFQGVIVKAAAQFLKAHFDCAVCQSPFLNDDQRANVMSLE